jgi:hypothetical protein
LPVIAAFVAVIALAAPAIAASPITPENRPTPLPGVTNGEVPPSLLVQVAPNCLAAREAASSLRLLFAEARASGVSLGAEECYRTLADQVVARRNATAHGNPACAASVSTSPSGGPVGTSMHGWGKAVDFTDAGRSLTFNAPGYAFLKAAAAAGGWNHPGWAEPGGSSCPEPWHWEWVGDGGRLGLDPVRADVVALLPSAGDGGYAVVNGLGAVTVRGSAVDRGSAAGIPIAWVVVGATPTPSRTGYWMVAGDGGVFSFGAAPFFGSTGGMRLNAPVLGMAPTATGQGYWLFAWDGGVFSFGDARFFGSTGSIPLVRPMVGMAATPSGGGYWLVASDGGVFSFGDAAFFGSTGGLRLVAPVVGMAVTPTGRGYWLVAADGGIFTFGDAAFHGSGAGGSASPVVGMVATQTGRGYWLQRANGQVQAFGDAAFYGNG